MCGSVALHRDEAIQISTFQGLSERVSFHLLLLLMQWNNLILIGEKASNPWSMENPNPVISEIGEEPFRPQKILPTHLGSLTARDIYGNEISGILLNERFDSRYQRS